MTTIPNIKRCFICDIEKPLTDFHKHHSRADGFRGECKECRKNKRKKDYNASHQRCTICDELKENNFKNFFHQKNNYGKKNHRRLFRTECKSCHKIRMRSQHLKNLYGLTHELYLEMLNRQKNKCAICKNKMKKPCVDHDHKNGLVRALLCDSCNRGIGYLKENINTFKNAIKYLEKHYVHNEF